MSFVVTYEIKEELEEFFFESLEAVIEDIQENIPPFDVEDPEDIAHTLDIIRKTILIQWLCGNGKRAPLEFEELLEALSSNHARISFEAKIQNLRSDVI